MSNTKLKTDNKIKENLPKVSNDCQISDKAKKGIVKEKKDKPKFKEYTLEKSKIIKTVNEMFPKIIKDDNGLLYMYDEKKKYFIEMKDNPIKSDIEELIYKTWLVIDRKKDEEGNEKPPEYKYLDVGKMNNLKKIIKRAINFKKLESPPDNLINCRNGVIDLSIQDKFKRLISNDYIRKKYFFNYILDIDYNPQANTEKLHNFIKSVVTEEESLITIAKILGHIQYSGAKLQKGFLFLGTRNGRNGKGTLTKLITKTIGESRSLTKSIEDFQNGLFEKYQLKDKTLYVEDDYKQGHIDDKTLSFLNKLISGAEENVQQKHSPAINIKYKATPIIQSNKMLKLKADDDGGFYLRWVIVHFNNEFGNSDKVDEFLGESLLNDKDVMSSMLNLLIWGYIELISRKKANIKGNFFKDNESKDIENWKIENNSALQFTQECCKLKNDKYVVSRDLFKYYKDVWNCGGGKLSETKFIKEIREHYNLDKIRKYTKNNKKINCIEGLHFIDDDDAAKMINFENRVI